MFSASKHLAGTNSDSSINPTNDLRNKKIILDPRVTRPIQMEPITNRRLQSNRRGAITSEKKLSARLCFRFRLETTANAALDRRSSIAPVEKQRAPFYIFHPKRTSPTIKSTRDGTREKC